MDKPKPILTGHSCSPDAATAVLELQTQIVQPQMALVIFFCSSNYDLPLLTAAIHQYFPETLVVGCTTAGEIGPAGYLDHSLTGISFSAASCTAVVGHLKQLQTFEISYGRAFAQDLLRRLESSPAYVETNQNFGFLLIDGLSVREEPVTHALQDGLGHIRMFGGSAGDELKFKQTWVFADGQFHTDSATLVLINTSLAIHLFKTQHFISGHERMVVTEVDAKNRIVKEINGLPAAAEYARLVDVDPEQLNSNHFAAWPVVVMIDGTDFVRSIQHANPDGSLTFYCAIDEGVVLRVAHGENMLDKLTATLKALEDHVTHIQGMLVCDCILRNLEATRNGSKAAVGKLLHQYNAVGFSTYGEQFGGVHINQTLTGIVFGDEIKFGDEEHAND
ncbi:FIST N-terminal domain-containing protein [Vibrio rhizosphaerae]|uniref:FIST N-terminal domain-containing protein n=1 Tax=Vibrio rhizosphaerae TaxID=398736 RepID=A0ABU4IYF8_9VIBR|nr:FIST N-terminal domain-containing protein [Vibrio rhizosphaerae]MDW6094319.1 FIST N-terminal domain-containing protein [Vibrio rhizosphaerae]